MIVKIQNLLGSDQDEVIASACTMLYNVLKSNKPERKNMNMKKCIIPSNNSFIET